MVVTMIVVCEVGFWLLLAAGLALRYVAGMPRAGAAVLMGEPLLELVLLVVTAVDLRNGATAGPRHGLAAVYVGFSVACGRTLIRWVDGHVRHRLAGGPPPARAPKYGRARAVHEWRLCAESVSGAAIAALLLQGAIWYVGHADRTAALRDWQRTMGWVALICVLIAASYTIWPKKDPADRHPEPSGEH